MFRLRPINALLLFTLFVWAGAVLFSQTVPLRFTKRYDAGIVGYSRMSSVWPIDSGYLATMHKIDSVNGKYYYGTETVLLDSLFEVVGRKSYGDTTKYYTGEPGGIRTIPDGFGNFWFWIYGFPPPDSSLHIYYGKFDKRGEILFEKEIQNLNQYNLPYDLVALPNGGALLNELAKGPFRYYTRLHWVDSLGNELARDSIPTLGTPFHHGSYGLTVDTSRKWIIVPSEDFLFTGFQVYNVRPRLSIYNYDGTLINRIDYTQDLLDIDVRFVQPIEDGGYLGMATHTFLDTTVSYNDKQPGIVKFDSNLNVVWSKYFFAPPRLYNSATLLWKDKFGNFFYTGIYDTAVDDTHEVIRIFLMKFNANLDSLWARLYKVETDTQESAARFPRQIQRTTDGGILLLVENQTNQGDYSVLMKLDSMGCLIEGCQFDTVVPPKPPHPPDTIWPAPNGQLIAYPNPSDGNWNLVWDVYPGDQSVLRIFDAAGRELLRDEILREERPSKLDLSHWAAGVYWLEIKSEKKRVFRTKVVLIR